MCTECGSDVAWKEFEGHCYSGLPKQRLAFPMAVRTCVALGGYVVEIESRGEQTFVSNTFFGNKMGASDIGSWQPARRWEFEASSWLGYVADQGSNPVGSSDSFVALTTGKDFSERKAPFTNFNEREPNNAGGSPGIGQDCLISDLLFGDGQWDDIQCVPALDAWDNVELSYAGVVCEKGAFLLQYFQ